MPGAGDPAVVFSVDELGPLNLLPREGMQWAPVVSRNRTAFVEFCRYLRSLYPPEVRIAIVCDNYSPHLSTAKDDRVGVWAAANNAEFAYVPTNASYLNRIECHFQALRYFALNGTDHRSHDEQNSMIRRYIAWRYRHTDNEELRAISLRAKVA